MKSFSVFLLSAAVAAPLVSFGAATWPTAKENVAAAVAKPDVALAKKLMADSDAAFDKRDFAGAVSLRRMARLVAFLSKEEIPVELRAWLFDNRDIAEEFVTDFSRQDDPKAVAKILSDLWSADTAGFKLYPRLAMAIALVYDAPCPPMFPHGQVSPEVLPRKLNPPGEVFAFFKESAAAHRLAQAPDKLAIDELAYVVGFVTPLSEMREAQKKRISRTDIPKLYFTINYDKGRFNRREYMWQGGSYSLASIKSKGGICVDQAYYTSTTAQAFGIPAFILSGVGADGFHAFVGYLERPGSWKLDVGRYPEQKFATGEGINPMTWGPLTDHELAFLQERFQGTPAYATAELEAERAVTAVAAKDFTTAEKLVFAACHDEPRCPAAWQSAAMLADARGDAPVKLVKLYTDAAAALSKFRDLEVGWRYKLVDLYEKNGKTDAAFDERENIVRRNVRARPDLAVVLAAQMLDSVMKGNDEKKTMTVFNRLASRFDDAGIEFCLKLAYPYQAHLLKAGLKKEAQTLARTVTSRFKAEKGGQLADMQRELSAWAAAGVAGTSKYYHEESTPGGR